MRDCGPTRGQSNSGDDVKSEDATRIIEGLVRNLSHELKNPLTTIKGYAQLLGLKSGDPGSVEKSQRMIQEQADRIDGILRDLYAAFIPRKFESLKFDAAETLREAISSLPEGVRADAGPIPEAHPAIGDRAALLEVFGLIVSGFDWTGLSGARCTISMPESDGRALIDIRFEGVDIPELSMEDFYLPFALKKYYLKGTEVYRAYFIARAGGWDITTLDAGAGGRRGLGIWV